MVVHEDAVEVRGRVRPADARVLVGGRAATVTNGEFRGRVPLREGANVIDVGASADDARTAWSALRVARETLVAVPELAGAARDDAVERLESLGLQRCGGGGRRPARQAAARRPRASARRSRARRLRRLRRRRANRAALERIEDLLSRCSARASRRA